MPIDEKRRQKKLAKKAAERKAKLAEKRSLVPSGPTAAARFPVVDCLVSINLFDEGIGDLILTRLLPHGKLAVAGFLVDPYCLGVKNALYREMDGGEFEFYRREINSQTPLESVRPSCLRKLVEDAVRYADSIGLAPHPDYAKAARLFGDIDASACTTDYVFGNDGKPLYVNGPYETPAQQRKIIETLKRHLGPDGFRCVHIVGDPDDASAARQLPGNLKRITYEIVDEPLKDHAYAKLPESVKDDLNAIYKSGFKQPRQAIERLKPLIEQYPDIPQIHNYLHSAYQLLGDQASADRILAETLERFPDYLFGRLAQANTCLDRGEIDRVAEIFDNRFDLSLIYPERRQFHRSEILNFWAVMARYFHAKGEQEKAELHYNLMKKLDPGGYTTQVIDRLIHADSGLHRALGKIRKLLEKARSSRGGS